MTSKDANVTRPSDAPEGEEYLVDLANQVASSQVATELLYPVAGAAAEAKEAAKKIPIIGGLAERVGDSYSYVRRLGMQQADNVISANAASMINSIGVTMLNSLHDHAMPQGIHRFVDNAYGHIWPQMKKSLMDSVMLSTGIEFREMAKRKEEQEDKPYPKTFFRFLAARLIYAMEPYDMTFWGVIRSPISLIIQVCFLFPLYGVSDILVLTLAASKYFTNFNQFGLIQFIISSKRLQFVTTGLLSGAYAFSKLFICATLREDRSSPNWHPTSFECETFAPGTHPTFIFEFFLFFLRSILNWAAFALLWNFERFVSNNRFKDRMLAAQQRLMAGAERRGLYGPFLTGILVLLTWQLSFAVVVSVFVAVYYAESSPDELLAFRLDDVGPFVDVIFIAGLTQLILHRLLTGPCMDATPARIAMVVSGLMTIYLWIRIDVPAFLRPLDWGHATQLYRDANYTQLSLSVLESAELDLASLSSAFSDLSRLPMTLELLIVLLSIAIYSGLLVFQTRAKRKDEQAVERLKNLMNALDTDRDGSVGKLELRRQYDQFFTAGTGEVVEAAGKEGVDAGSGKGGADEKPFKKRRASAEDAEQGDRREVQSFDQFWSQLDTNQDGRVTLYELAVHYGVAHLVEDADLQKSDGLDPEDPQYIEKRLEELHAREFGYVEKRPGGALVYFVIWDVCMFTLACIFIAFFLYSNVIDGEFTNASEALADWRIRCGLYFFKVVIALLSFPFLVFAMPLMQIWLTHVKPTGYDRAGNCVPSLSASQIKAKFRQEYIAKQQQGAPPGPWYEECWDKVLGVDPQAELAIEEKDIREDIKKERPAKGSVVELARQRRMQQARRERLPEASLMMAEHITTGPLAGKLQIKGDPGSLMML